MNRVNGTMYGKFSVEYRIIPEKAMVIPQFQQTLVEDENRCTYENTLPGITNIATPMAKSTPVTQASQIPVIPNVPLPERDMVEPVSSERARTAYLECQIQDMSSVRLPLDIPSMEEESRAPTDLSDRIWAFCKERKEKRKQEWESLKIALDEMKESKGKHPKQPDEKEREITYSQMAQNMEKTRTVVRNSTSRASTISAEEQQMALNEEDFSIIKKRWTRLTKDWTICTKIGMQNMEMLLLCVTFGNIYQKSYHCLCPHVDPHLSPPTAQQWVSMCIRPICVHIDQKDSYAISMRVLLQQCIDLF